MSKPSEQWLEDNHLSDRWIKAKYRCTKKTKGCAIYPWAARRAGRLKCDPCEYLKVEFRSSTPTARKEK